MPIIGLDIGTTGCKAILFTEEGKIISSASQEYAIDIPNPGWADQNSEEVWRLAQMVLRQVIQSAGNPSVAAVGLSVQGEAVMPVDASGKALLPAILGMDTRTEEQNNQIKKHFGARELFQRTGMPIHTINTLPKLLWLRQNQADEWKLADRFLLYEDFIIRKMTGEFAISRCLASRTQMYQVDQMDWSTTILDYLQLSPEKLSPVYDSGHAVAQMRPDLARELGLPNRPVIATGGHDQACGALGVGLVRPGLAMVSTGTAEVVEISLDRPALNDTIRQGNLSCYSHVVPGLYLIMTLNHSGGLLLRWFRDTFCQDEIRQSKTTGQDAYDLILGDSTQNLSKGPAPLLVLPHFAGSGTPTFDISSRGAFVGMTFGTTKHDIAQAILEGLTFELRVNLDLLKDAGVSIDELRAIGGGARSDFWLQLKANITGIPVQRPAVTEAACWGAALLAGQAAGIYSSAAKACDDRLQFTQRFHPHLSPAYEERYRLYRQLYPVLKPINTRL